MRQDRVSPGMARAGQGRAAALRPAAPAPSRLGQVLEPVLRFVGKRPGLVLSAIAVLGTTGAVGWNALHQANRHPAPLFKPKVQVEAPRRTETTAIAPPPAPIPMPVPRPDPSTVGSLSAAPAPAASPVVKAAAPGGDPIGNLIRGGEPKPQASELRPDPRVTAVQKALTKLGYGPLKADGFLGATTRQALERFERDSKLPVTGGLGIRTTRQLASASGTQIE